MTISEEAPTRTDLVRRAQELIPLIRKHVPWQEENRVLHEDVLTALHEAGIMKMRTPERFGGSAVDVRTLAEVVATIAQADGATGWTVSTWTIGSWLAGLLPDEAQDEIFADPNVRICGTVGPHGMAVPTEGGYILNGRWPFNTGSPQSQWDTHAILVTMPDGSIQPAMAAVPLSDLTVIDDWHTAGLRGTGSMTTVAENVFIPENKLLHMLPVIMHGQHKSVANADHPAWKVPFLPFAVASAAAPALGMAYGAWEYFFERLPGRGITYTNYDNQAEAPITHLQIAEARAKMDEAEFHLYRAADRLDDIGLTGAPMDMELRTLARLDAGAVCIRAKEAVDVLVNAGGGSSVYTKNPIQRIERDVQTINLHGIMHWETNAETYGRVLAGLEPNTVFL